MYSVRRPMFHRSVVALATFVLGSLLLMTAPAVGQSDRAQELSILTATGSGEVRVSPDVATVRLGVQTEAPTASEARDQNADKAARTVSALKELGIAEKSIQTSMFQIYPVRRFDTPSQQGEPPIVGYSVTNTIAIRTENLSLVPSIIDKSIAAGANRVEGVDFSLRDDSGARQQALDQAVASARQNAQTMAKAANVELVRVHAVQQGGVGVIPPSIGFGRGAALEAGVPTPIFPGEAVVNATVTVSYVIR